MKITYKVKFFLRNSEDEISIILKGDTEENVITQIRNLITPNQSLVSAIRSK